MPYDTTTDRHALLLDIRGVQPQLRRCRRAERRRSSTIADNEFFALLGPSGCGKTTLLRIIAGFETPSAGSILLDGDDLIALPAHRRPVNMMFQSYALFPHMTVEKNVAYGLEPRASTEAEIRRRVGEVLEIVGLTEVDGAARAKLSGGQRQRVALGPRASSSARGCCCSTSRCRRSTARCAPRCSWSSSGCSTRSASPSSSSPTTRRRPCRWPTASR